MPITYDSRSNIVTITTPDYFLILPGNRNRISLSLSGMGDTLINHSVVWSTTESANGSFIFLDPTDNIVMPYRDWGPLIKEPIYAMVSLAFMDVLAVETFIVPSSRR